MPILLVLSLLLDSLLIIVVFWTEYEGKAGPKTAKVVQKCVSDKPECQKVSKSGDSGGSEGFHSLPLLAQRVSEKAAARSCGVTNWSQKWCPEGDILPLS